ncbi:hypothetical protein AVEN_43190-1 [Araneus ventricosus]|uniref:Uncharacterized protein n=1 Tax=Araneus ventricosus TaxID=182803 RepID=A0A4Y2F382_ARAVE|nr:hypothetical protein AVEN_43190-1 [Araneus ventricosus]
MLFHKEALLQTCNGITKYKLLAIFPHIRHRHWYICRTVRSIPRNHPGKNRWPASKGTSSQPCAPLHCFGRDVPIVRLHCRKKVKMGVEGPYADHKAANMAIKLDGFCSWTIMQDFTQGTLKNTFVTWDGRDWITRSEAPSDFHLFPALSQHYQYVTSEPMKRFRKAVKNFLRSLGTKFATIFS